jgi:hypothetical protein
MVQECPNCLGQGSFVIYLTLPNDQYIPPCGSEFLLFYAISSPIVFQLRLPKIEPRFRQASKLATRITVSMPEATMHENRLAASRENQVWAAREIAAVKAVAVAHAMHQATNDHLGGGILAPNAAHSFASLPSVEGVHRILRIACSPNASRAMA